VVGLVSGIDKIVLAELLGEELSRLDLEEVSSVAKEVRQSLTFCLSKVLPCSELVNLLLDLALSLSRVRLAKMTSGRVPKDAGSDSHIDLEFLRGIVREVLMYYLAIVLGLVDHELRIPVKFEEEVYIAGRRYRPFASRLLTVSEAVSLQHAGAKIKVILPRDVYEYLDAVLSTRK
jgi:hypothetical protein